MTHFVGLICTVISLNDNVQIKLPMQKHALEVTANVKSLKAIRRFAVCYHVNHRDN